MGKIENSAGGGLDAVLRRASDDFQATNATKAALANEVNAKVVRDRAVSYAAEIYGYASAYDNAVVIAGYAAFFALWAGASDDISRNCRLITAALMGSSLVFYIIWQVLQMLIRQKFEFEKAGIFEFAADFERFNLAWMEIDQRHQVATLRLIRYWPVTFVPSLVLGLIGGMTLAYNALATTFDWWRIV